MNVRIETPLHRRLVEHRTMPHAGCAICLRPGCCQHCTAYFDIARRATAARVVQEGRLNLAYSWLSVREDVDF